MTSTELRNTGRPQREAFPPLPSEDYSVKVLPPTMNLFSMTMLFVLVLFFITNVPTAVAGGPAGLTLWIVGVAFFFPCALASAQLGVLFPHEGGIYTWTYHTLGRSWSFFVGLAAWLPGPLLILATGDLFVSYIQSLNQNWLVSPWQQGLVLMGVVAFSGLLCLQRTAMFKTLVNVTGILILVAALLVVLAAGIWLIKGHPSATNFTHLPDWNPFTAANFPLFGVITLGYLGVNLPLNLAGELAVQDQRARQSIITKHLLYGVVIVLVCYLAVTTAVLVVQGANGANNLFAMVSTVDMTMGKVVGNVVALCIMTTFVIATAVYNAIFARFIMVAGFDQRVASAPGRLSRNRVPARAIILQTIFTIALTGILFLVIPYLGLYHGKPTDVATIDYFIGVGTGTLLWAFATIFIFVNIFVLYARNRAKLRAQRIVPLPVLLVCSALGLLTGLIAMIDTLFNSYIPPLISNSSWILFVGGFTLILIIVAAVATPVLSSEAVWEQTLSESETLSQR